MTEERFKITKLRDAEDWVNWKFTLRNLLDAEDAFEVAEGSWTKQESLDSAVRDEAQRERYELELKAWIQADKRARKLIVTTVGEKPMQYLMTCETAAEMWNKLLTVYEQRSEASLLMVLCQFYGYKKEPTDDMATHISKLERLRERLKQMGEKVSDMNFMARIISTLPDTYTHFASAWDSAPDERRTIANMTSRLMMEEARIRARETEPHDSVALLAKKKPDNRSEGRFRHQGQANKTYGKQSTAYKIRCFKCHKEGHMKRDCKAKKIYDNSENKQKVSTLDGDAFVGELDKETTFSKMNCWYADSGASHHMSNKRDWFSNYMEYKNPRSITIGKGLMYACGQGDIAIRTYANGKWSSNYLERVLYVPESERNLFSIGSALDHGLIQRANNERMEFYKAGCQVAVGVRDGRLYKMLFKVIEPTTACVAVTKDPMKLWHERLGHQNNKHVQKILKSQGIDVERNEDFCDACMYGKQHRKSFGHSQSEPSLKGELIHADVCGPMEEMSLGGARYFIVFKDDLSHFRMIYFLKHKNEVKDKLKLCLAYVKRSTGNEVKIIRTDNGTEFNNKDVKAILEEHGIVHQTSVAYTPEQNGSAEREMRTIVELARTMIHAKEMQKRFWAEACHTAVYVLNRTGTSGIAEKPPFEVWHGRQADISHLRIFGTEYLYMFQKKKGGNGTQRVKRVHLLGMEKIRKDIECIFWIQGLCQLQEMLNLKMKIIQ